MKTFYFNQLLKNQFLIILLLFTTIFILPAYAQIEGNVLDQVSSIAKNYYENNMNGTITEGGIEPDALTFSSLSGENAGDNFGRSVSSAGDLNGDGYDDIIIGAHIYDDIYNEGKIYIYYGGPTMDYLPDITIIGENQDDRFGTCVSSAGDLNGDGYSDVIVGAPLFDSGGYTQNGKAYIYFGGESMDTNPDVVMYGEGASDQFGSSLSSAGDVNGDGIDDIIIGANGYGAFYGRAYLYFGSSTISGTPAPDKIWTGEHSYDYFGFSVSSAGDVNGDGFSDIIIGAYENDNVAVNAGAAYIYFGGAGSTAGTDSLKLTGEAYSNWYGNSVSGAGDVNGDGFSDVIVGAYNYNNTNPDSRGRAYIYYGGSSMDVVADIIMDGEDDGNQFGYSVAGLGDVNGDGFSDVIVSAPFWFVAPSQNQGRVYIYFGGTNADNIPDIVLDRVSEGPGYFGWSVSSAGDVNGDGFKDILVGAPLSLGQKGKAFLYKFSATGLTSPSLEITGDTDNMLGYCVSDAGDLNGDGFDDFVVGAPFYGSNEGRVYIFFGGNIVNPNPDLILYEGVTDELFGASLAGVGDINGDGYDDLLVGAVSSDCGGDNCGAIYIYLGGANMDNINDKYICGGINEAYFGFDVAGAGDVNGDGFNDIIVSASNWFWRGGVLVDAALIILGNSTLDLNEIILLLGEESTDFFGCSVSSAGDLNGDGFSDVIVGAWGHSASGSQAGRAFIYYGGITMDNVVDLILYSEGGGDEFGYSVYLAGDINLDGYSDVIVGAPMNDDGGNNAGKAYIYYGGLAMDENPDLTFIGENAGDSLGFSVYTAGDVNGDGFSDLLIGALKNNEVGIDAGKSYIYYGSSSIDNEVDIVMKGENALDQFGFCVSTAGDYNNDGLDDVVIGAPFAGTQDGMAYLFLSSFPPVNPNLIFVKDVPYDQGGYVQLKWARSGYDVPGVSKITNYLIQRSFPPGETGFAWETIGSLPATHETFYSYVASTPNDSMTNNSGTFYFRITARTNLPEEYWRSNIMYGHSVDNLPPLPPMNFDGVLAGGNVNLHWNPNLEGDLKDYVLYRTDYAGADPDTLTPYATVPDTLYIDTEPLSSTSYYYLRARDIHDNESEPVTKEISVVLSANIKLFLEGPYLAGNMSVDLNTFEFIPLSQPFNTTPWNYAGTETIASIPSGAVDWILVELRSDQTTLVSRRAGFVKSNGSISDLDGISLLNFPEVSNGDYYVVIYQRNHIPIMTANAITLSETPSLYDFTTDQSQAYGTNAMVDLGAGDFGMYSGDASKDGQIDADDRAATWNERNQVGYKDEDVTMDGQVDADDRATTWNNRNIVSQVPTGALLIPVKNEIKIKNEN